MSSIEFTGERFLPQVGGEIRQEHLHRYAFAAALVDGKVVLDAACGEGYGSELLAAHASEVVGVDIDGPTITRARKTYAARRNLRFEHASVLELPLKAASVDVVVSFETLEHLAEQDIMLMEFHRVLRPEGLLLISTPDVEVYRGLSAEPNPFHVKELDAKELRALLKRQFRHQVFFGHRLATGSAIYPLPGGRTAPRIAAGGLLAHDDSGIEPGMPRLPEATYLIAAASNAPIATPPGASMLVSAVDDLYAEYRRIAKWASGVDAEWRSAQAAWQQERDAWERERSEGAARLEQARAEAALKAEEQAHSAQSQALDALREQHRVALAEREASEAARSRRLAERETHLQAQLQVRLQEVQALAAAELEPLRAELAAARSETSAAVADLNTARAALAEAERDAAARRTQLAERIAGELLRHQHELRSHDEAAAARVAELERQLQSQADQVMALSGQLQAQQAEAALAQQRLRDENAAALKGAREAAAAAAAELAASRERAERLAGEAKVKLADLRAEFAQAQAVQAAEQEALRRSEREQLEAAARSRHAAELEALQARMHQEAEQARSALQSSLQASLETALAGAQAAAAQRLAASEAEWRQRQARALVESRRREREQHEQVQRSHAAWAEDMLGLHRRELEAALAEQARLREEMQTRLLQAQALQEEQAAAHAAAHARERAALEARIEEQAELVLRLEQAASHQLDEARRAHAQERAQMERRLADAVQQAALREKEATERLALLAEAERRTLADLSARLSDELASTQARWQAAQAAASDRERELSAKLEEVRIGGQAAQLAAIRELEAAREQARTALGEAQKREQAVQRLLVQRSELAAVLGRELLVQRAGLGSRMASPWQALRRYWTPLESLAVERRVHEMALGAVLLPSTEPADTKKADVPGPRALLPTDMNKSSPTPVAQSVEDLMELDDITFLQAAYRAMLGRAPDAGGLRHYTEALLAGRSRLQVLADLHFSAEGKDRRVTLAGFDAAMRQLRLRRIPVVGRLLAPAARAPSTFGVRRDLSFLTGQVNRIDGTLHGRLDDIERVLQVGVQGLAQHAMNAYARVDARLASIEQALAVRVDAELRSLAVHEGESDARLPAPGGSGAGMGEITGAVTAARRETLALGEMTAIVQSLGRFQWPPETDLWRWAERWVAAEPAEFTRHLFEVALDRQPHDYELAHFTARVEGGSSRWMLVDKVLQSPEFAATHLPGSPAGSETVPRPEAATTPAAAAPLFDAPMPRLPTFAVPVVSVVVPVYGKVEYTLQCLRSIVANPPRVPFEVIVVDDASPDGSAETLAEVGGIRLLRNPQNLGFIRSCNRGAGAARGAFLCLLNNDTEVLPGWLDELHATFDLFPGTGLAGSKLLYPDGSLQEAGGILWRDGSAWNYGRGQDPSLPEFSYAREVDYCSGASIMLPTDLYRRLGGLDEHYLPAYCEDSDIALKVRQAGLRVIYQAASRVIHHEGITSGTDTGSGVKAYQVANTKKLYERWQGLLAGYQDNGVDVERAKDRMSTRRVLVIDIVTPSPDQDAGSVTVVNFLTLLREMRFQVTFIPEDNFLYMPDYTVALQRTGVEALYAPAVTSVEQHLAAHGGRYDLVLLWRPTVVDRHLAAVRRHCPRAKVAYHTVDLHYLRMEREAELHQDAAKARAAAEMKRMELAAVQGVDSAIVHSTHEVDVLATRIPVDNVFVFPLIINVPGSAAPFESRAGLAFVGGYQHVPNVDAVLYFASEVMPLLRRRLPGVRFHVIGSKAPPEVTSLAGDDIIIEGFVPELQPLLDRMRISVAPLRYGAGIKGKVGNSMAMGLPVVASSIAVEGMQLRDRHDVLIADGPEALADAICELYADKALWLRLQANALVTVDALSGAGASYANLQRLLAGIGVPTDPPLHALRLYRDGR